MKNNINELFSFAKQFSFINWRKDSTVDEAAAAMEAVKMKQGANVMQLNILGTSTVEVNTVILKNT